MRTRSSRFFVVLLHLVGVSQRYHHRQDEGWWSSSLVSSGIVGVQPSPLQLERVDLNSDEGELLSSSEEPVWLQDDNTGHCLGPTGTFTECGDATLWFVRKRTIRRRMRRPPANTGEDRGHVPETKEGLWDWIKRGDTSSSLYESIAAWTFQVVDYDYNLGSDDSEKDEAVPLSSSTPPWRAFWNKFNRLRRAKQRRAQRSECLERSKGHSAVDVQKCRAETEAVRATWIVNEDGSLEAYTSNNSHDLEFDHPPANPEEGGEALCLHRETSGGSTSLESCHGRGLSELANRHKVHLSFIRYRAVTVPPDEEHEEMTIATGSDESVVDTSEKTAPGTVEASTSLSSPGVASDEVSTKIELGEISRREIQSDGLVDETKDSMSPLDVKTVVSLARRDGGHERNAAEGAASFLPARIEPQKKSDARSRPHHHPQLILSSRPLLLPRHQAAAVTASVVASSGGNEAHFQTGVRRSRRRGRRPSRLNLPHKESPATRKPLPLRVLLRGANPVFLAPVTRPSASLGREKIGGNVEKAVPSSLLAHPPSAAPNADDVVSAKRRRMLTHPYIRSPAQEIWTDPQTGLEYLTDVGQYFGLKVGDDGKHNAHQSDAGTQRHVITGVGLYRKGYVVKVYGIAYYVSRDDVLTDMALLRYASMTAEELRRQPEFYSILRKMRLPSSNDLITGSFDRTLLLKTNMQLSAETMRRSLHADWRMLDAEAKDTLISSSLEPRPATAKMLEIINRADNPSRCSCSQVAPKEYEADPSCCARGTELAFVWLKSGGLQVRLHGEVMDTFQRTDIAEGIFYEYLRTDDPISPEFRDRVVDGFPSLLAPLAQVDGFSIGHSMDSHSDGCDEEVGNNIVRIVGGLADAAAELVGVFHKGLSDAANLGGNAFRSIGHSVQNFGHEVDRRRVLLSKGILSSSSSTGSEGGSCFVDPLLEASPLNLQRRVPSRGRVFGYPVPPWLGTDYVAPDEIGPMKVHPTTREIFLTLVHLYLLLLFIVSFPGSYTTRTKLTMRKSRLASSPPFGVEQRCPTLATSSSRLRGDATASKNLSCQPARHISFRDQILQRTTDNPRLRGRESSLRSARPVSTLLATARKAMRTSSVSILGMQRRSISSHS